MNIKLIVDPSSSLSSEIINEYGIQVLEKQVNVDGTVINDTNDQEVLFSFYENTFNDITKSIAPEFFSEHHVHHHFTEYVIDHCDYAIIQTPTDQFDELFEFSSIAQPFVLKTYRAKRERGQIDVHFGMRVMNSGTQYAGLGLLAIYTAELIQSAKSKHEFLLASDTFKDKVYTYSVAAPSSKVAERFEEKKSLFGSLTGKGNKAPIVQSHQNSVTAISKASSFKDAVNQLFSGVAKSVQSGLSYPVVTINYAGDLDNLDSFSGYNELCVVAEANNVRLITSLLSMTSAADLGPGSVSVAIASDTAPSWS